MEGGVKERKAKERRERIAKECQVAERCTPYHLRTWELETGPVQGWSQPCSQPVTGDFLKTKQTNRPERVTGRGGKKKKKEL